MKKLLIPVIVLGSLLPVLAFATYNDVTLTTNADISVNSITMDVLGSDATIETIAVGSTSFTATLQSGSSLKVSPQGNKQMSYDMTYTGSVTPQVDYVCTSATSTLLITASSQATLVVTPLTTSCSGPGESTSGGGSSSPGSSSGGGGGTVAVVATQTTTETAQISALLAQITALQARIAALSGVTLPSTASATAKAVLTSNLSKGSRGSSVKVLQQFLNTHGFIIATSGPGSPGNETDMLGNLTVQAIQKFQKQYGIASPGVPGYGTVGPKTRAKINELSAK